jgi:hypothetical protein
MSVLDQLYIESNIKMIPSLGAIQVTEQQLYYRLNSTGKVENRRNYTFRYLCVHNELAHMLILIILL